MDEATFLTLMNFPSEWKELGMFPAALSRELRARYRPGQEDGSEHDRNGAFHWWLRQNPSAEHLLILIRLTELDPDPLMASDVRRYIARSGNADERVRQCLNGLGGDGMEGGP